MRIIYGHDYYDNALAYGRDESIVFVREKNRTLRVDDFPLKIHTTLNFWFRDKKRKQPLSYGRRSIGQGFTATFDLGNTEFNIKPIMVVFCGKIYNGLRLDSYDRSHIKSASVFFWNLENFQTWMDHIGIEIDVDSPHYWYKKNKVLTNLNAAFAVEDASRMLMDWLIENKIVIAVWQPPSFNSSGEYFPWEINSDQLKSIQFFRKIDPFQAFQEISMWVGGVLPRAGAEMAQVSDIVRIEKHGFDKVTSFRKAKKNG